VHKKSPINFKKSSDDEDDRINVFRSGRSILFFHEINGSSSAEFFKLMNEIEKEKSSKPIDIIISSEGGTMSDGLAIYDRIRQSEFTIHTKAIGCVQSMALVIFLAGDYRYGSVNTIFMNHQGLDEVEGKLSDLEISIKEGKRLEDLITTIISEHTGQSERKLKNEVKIGDHYFDTETALEEGYIHEIIHNKRIIRRRKKRS